MSIPGITSGSAGNGSGTAPLLGSKVSLISQAEIRYEGILYTVDPAEKTIALAKVHSYGTEDRQTDNPLPPQADVYEYIIFQAGNIKDLKVCESPQPATAGPWPKQGSWGDPAIISASKEQKAPSYHHDDYLANAAATLPHLRNLDHGAGNQASQNGQRGRSLTRGRGGRGFANRGQQRGGGTMGGFATANDYNSFGGYRGGRGRGGAGYARNFSNEGGQHNLGNFTNAPGTGERSGFNRANRGGALSPRARGGGRLTNRSGSHPAGSHTRGSPQQGMRRVGNDDLNGFSRGHGMRGGRGGYRGGRDGQGHDQQHVRRQRSRTLSTGSAGDQSNKNRSGGYANSGYARGERGYVQGRGYLYRGGSMLGNRTYGYQNRREGFAGQRWGNRMRNDRVGGFRRGGRLSSATGVPTSEHPQLVIPADDKEEYEEEYDFEKAEREFQQKISVRKDDKDVLPDDQQKDSDDENLRHKAGEDRKDVNDKNIDSDAEQTAQLMIEIYYDKKKSFFDKISRDTDEEQQDQKQSIDWAKERELNHETFGDMALRTPYRQPINNRLGFRHPQQQGAGFRGGLTRFRGHGGDRNGGYRGGNRGMGRGGYSGWNRQDGRQMNRNRIQV